MLPEVTSPPLIFPLDELPPVVALTFMLLVIVVVVVSVCEQFVVILVEFSLVEPGPVLVLL